MVLTILLFPAAVFLAVLSSVALSLLPWSFRSDWQIALAFAVNAAVLVAAFFFIWRGMIAWTPARARGTWRSLLATLGLCALASIAVWIFDRDGETWAVLTSLLICASTLLWLALCIRHWQESPKERAARIAAAGNSSALCPVCKYDLSGLVNLRCPECGNEFTLGRLQDEHRRRQSPAGLD